MVRKLHGPEEVPWANPLRDVQLKPYLGEEFWPDDPRTEKWKETASVLKRFYCEKRAEHWESAEALRRYLANPEKYLIVWGRVGIGKTWYLRYHLLVDNTGAANRPYHAGVVDMLSGRDREYGVYEQLQHSLEAYFQRFCGSTPEALKRYVTFDWATLCAKAESDLSEAEHHDIEKIVKTWMELRYTPAQEATAEYVRRLLATLQYLDHDELLILLVDNIDKTPHEEQQRLVRLAVQLLRHPKIRLIIPLRKSSQLLRNRFSELREFSYSEMELHPLDLREMLHKRFQHTREGLALSGKFSEPDPLSGGECYTFPQVFVTTFGQNEASIPQSGQLLLTVAESNARESLALTEKLIYSDQLKGLKNLSQPEYAIAALMLSGPTVPDAAAGLVNLFNNEEPQKYGNVLIRFRVLEYFWRASHATTVCDNLKQGHLVRF